MPSCLCVCVVCVCVTVCVCVYMCVHVCACVCVCVCMFVCVVCLYVYVCVCMCVHVYVHMFNVPLNVIHNLLFLYVFMEFTEVYVLINSLSLLTGWCVHCISYLCFNIIFKLYKTFFHKIICFVSLSYKIL